MTASRFRLVWVLFKAVLQNLGKRLSHNWNAKLASALLAVLLWIFVSSSQTLSTQRSITVALRVLEPDGLSVKTLMTGVPANIDVLVAGPGNLVESLKPEQFDAVLDLRASRGDFRERVSVVSPQGAVVQRVMPSDIIGRVTLVERKFLNVNVSFLRLNPQVDSDDFLNHAAVSPKTVMAEGPESEITQATIAVAYIDLDKESATARVYALNNQGHILPNVQLSPSEVDISLSKTPIFATKRVPLIVSTPQLVNFDSELSLSQPYITLLGKSSLLSRVKSLPAELPTFPQAQGEYDLRLELTLPAEVEARDIVYARLRLSPKASFGDAP